MSRWVLLFFGTGTMLPALTAFGTFATLTTLAFAEPCFGTRTTLTLLAALWTGTALAFTLNITFGLLNEGTMAQFELACLRVNLQKFYLHFVTFLET